MNCKRIEIDTLLPTPRAVTGFKLFIAQQIDCVSLFSSHDVSAKQSDSA